MSATKYPKGLVTVLVDTETVTHVPVALDPSFGIYTILVTETRCGEDKIISCPISIGDMEKTFYPEGDSLYPEQVVGIALSALTQFYGKKGWIRFGPPSVNDASTLVASKAASGTNGMEIAQHREIQMFFRKKN